MTQELAQALKHARAARGLTVREAAAAAGVAVGTIVRYETRPDPVTPKTLHRIADALGVAATMSTSGEWTISPTSERKGDGSDDASPTVTVTDGTTLLTLRVPPGFLESLSEDQRAGLEADALLEVMRLAREATRGEQQRQTRQAT